MATSTSAGRWESFGDSLKLTDTELQSLLVVRQQTQGRRTDSRSPQSMENTRACRRLCVHGASWIPVEFKEAGGGTCRVRVYPVDLSASGMCILTDRFVHKGTACALTLHLQDGESILINAKVVRCELLQGRAHEVGVEFDQAMDLGLVVGTIDASTMTPAGAASSPAASEIFALHVSSTSSPKFADISRELRAISERVAAVGAEASKLNAMAAALSPSA